MVDQPTLLPPNGKPFIRVFEQTLAYETRLAAGVELIYDVKGRRLPAWLSFLLYEYGLLELTPYVPSPYTLLDQGREWQDERDTWGAIARGLTWVGAPALIHEAPPRRRWWNSFQLYLDSLPPADDPHLERIDRVTQLGKPYRSDFRRGVNGYDVPALEGDRTRLDSSLLDAESGVRLRSGGPLWSFGRTFQIEHTLTETEGTAIGNWLDYPADQEYVVNFSTLVARIGGVIVPLEEAIEFSRSGPKWHSDGAGVWHRFEADEIAATDRGASIETEAERLSAFTLDFNPLEDEAAATVLLVDVADPFGGLEAIRVRFDGNAGRVLYVPADGLLPNTTYSVSFFARLVSVTGNPAVGGGGGFRSIYDQLVVGQWVRVTGNSFTTADHIDGQWFDLALDTPGTVVVVELFGFQIEAGARATSPVEGGEEFGAIRAADHLTVLLPGGLSNVLATFEDGTGQSFLQTTPPFDLDPAELGRSVIREIGNLATATWESMSFPWTDATFPWNSDVSSQRMISLAQWFEGRDAYFALRNSGGQVIGYRRARLVRQILADFLGPIRFGGARYVGSVSGTTVYAEAMTDAGNGAGQLVTSVGLIVNVDRAPGVPPGKLWLAPNELTGGDLIAVRPVSIPLRATVRERIKLLLRF